MTPEQMTQKSQEKVNQIINLAKILHVEIQAVQKIDQQSGIIRNEILWIDNEKYPPAPAEPVATEAAQPAQEAPKDEEAVEEAK
jgi:hypothetical protein